MDITIRVGETEVEAYEVDLSLVENIFKTLAEKALETEIRRVTSLPDQYRRDEIEARMDEFRGLRSYLSEALRRMDDLNGPPGGINGN